MRHPHTNRGGWVKPLLIAAAVLVVGGSLAAYGAFSWLRGTVESVEEGTLRGLEQGAEVGRHVDEAKCLELAKERAAVTSSLASAVGNGTYLEGCYLTARPTPGFCKHVPPKGAELEEAWTRKQCPGDPGERAECRNLALRTQVFCSEGQIKAGMDQVRAYIAQQRAAGEGA